MPKAEEAMSPSDLAGLAGTAPAAGWAGAPSVPVPAATARPGPTTRLVTTVAATMM